MRRGALVAPLAAAWLLGIPALAAQPAPTPPITPPSETEPSTETEPPADGVAEPPALAPAPVERAAGNAALYAALPPLELPAIDPDVLAFGSTFEMITAQLGSTSTGQSSNGEDDERTVVDLALGTRYYGSMERRAWGGSVIASADDALNRTPDGDNSVIRNNLSLALSPEARYYLLPESQAFAYLAADFSTTIASVSVSGTGGDSDSNAPGTVGVALGVGVGRVLAIDSTVRLRRLEQALAARGLLAGALPEAVGTDVARTWYALRNDIGTYKTLAYTMKRLADAGLLAGEPDLRSTYEALQILADPFIVDRRHGWEARGGLGVVKPFIGWDQQDEPDARLAIVGSAQYEQPLATTGQLSLRGKLLYELGGTDDTNRAYALRGFATYTRVRYNETQDPLGALTASAELGLAGVRVTDLNPDPPEMGLDVLGRLDYSKRLNRGSLANAGVTVDLRNDGTYSLGLSLGITWGVATGFFTPYTPAASGL